MREIGSEFWAIDTDCYNNELDFLNVGKDYKLLMSGRTAIDYILREVNDDTKIVYMPDYCCESMVKPFLDNGYSVKYYKCDLINNKYLINENIGCSIFFAMSYFGYNKSNMDYYIEHFSKRNVVVIEDITHRLLSDVNHSDSSTYLVASLRKWFPIISGGVAIKMRGDFSDNMIYEIGSDFVEIKEKAMNLKKDYVVDGKGEKDVYLALFDKSNTMIEDYQNKLIDKKSVDILKMIDIDKVKKKRIDNCLLIENMLRDNDNVDLLYKLEKGDCPLFVPVVVENRNSIRAELIKHHIYLPIHWPNDLEIDNGLYKNELSLVCDQRYDSDDIRWYINFFNKVVGSSR